ncbi:MAG: hypothetical protein IT211_01895 [Armatimonadetes bacterium]|nr:hypothetical protein [Armatimonadota bacterium]
MNPLHIILLSLWGLIVAAALLQRGGALEGLRAIERKGALALSVGLCTLLAGGLLWRVLFTITPATEQLIMRGESPADSVAAGFDTKARFRGLAQPLGRIVDRNGEPLAEYALRGGHLRRSYPAGPATAHLVGYWTGPVRDGVGIEKGLTLLNDSLRDDLPHDARLAIDLRLQRAALTALNGKTGAVVVMNASNGEVLAAANYPTYDPNRVGNDTAWKRWARDKTTRPLTSRAIKDNFSPGSSIKPFIALAAHELGTPLPEESGFTCVGEYVPGRGITPISDHGSAHGRIAMPAAMRYSCNTYFAHLAYRLVGFQPLAEYFDSLGFNQRVGWNTGLFLNNYSTLLPAQSWVRARDVIARTRVGIGQASVKTNPIHMAVLMSGIANGGTFIRPTLEIGRQPDTLRWSVDRRSVAWLRELLRQPLLQGGTAAGIFNGLEEKGITIYGKTGTADREPDGREPSWWISFGEKAGKAYAVVVAIQHRDGQYAGQLNAPIARSVYQALERLGYFGEE